MKRAVLLSDDEGKLAQQQGEDQSEKQPLDQKGAGGDNMLDIKGDQLQVDMNNVATNN